MGLGTFLAFVDYKKAFDSVDRSLLLYKLLEIGINGNFFNAISAMFSNPRARVILNDFSTSYFDCPIGVKQGTVSRQHFLQFTLMILLRKLKIARLVLTLVRFLMRKEHTTFLKAYYLSIFCCTPMILCA